MSNLQWILVDDTDPRVNYSGAWSTEGQATLNDIGQFGAPFLLTSHGTTTKATLSFTFSGSQLVVAGSQLVPNDLKSSGGTCSVDGIAQPITYTTENATNRVVLCRFADLSSSSSTQHTVVINAVPAGQKPFWFDYIKYLPTSNTPAHDEFVQILPDNQNLLFDGNWVTDAPENILEARTNVANAVMSYSFVGTSIAWYGSFNHSASLGPANLSYTVDERSPVTVQILPSTKARADLDLTMEQVFFNATDLLPGTTHRLKVTYLGNPQAVPLSLNQFIVTSGASGSDSNNATATASSSTAVTSSTEAPTNTAPATSSDSGHKTPKVAIAVSLVGTAIILGLAAFFIIRRRRRQRAVHPFESIELPQDVSPRPFDAPSTAYLESKGGTATSTPIAEFVPISKSRVEPLTVGHASSSTTNITATTGASTTNRPLASESAPSPEERDAATYLWNLLLQHRGSLSTLQSNPNQHNPNIAQSSGIAREEDHSGAPPAYGT